MKSAIKFLFIVLGTLIVCAGCGDDKSTDKPNNTNNVDTQDAGGDTDVDTMPELECPNEGELVCDGRCLNVQYSMVDCGACGNACQVGSMTCNDGACECLGDKTMCNERCVDTSNSRENCGTCNTTCAISDACVDGACVLVSDRTEVTQVLANTNTVRASDQDCGEYGPKSSVGSLMLNQKLTVAAQGHAEDMATNMFMEHEGSDGSTPFQRAERAGYDGSIVGENIARGYNTPEAVVQGWLESDGHCQNMMNGRYSELGVGYAVASDGEEFWVQLFGSP